MEENTEFSFKWSALCDAQVEEGIREPVKAYEFMNLFYVEEGNKRVSVLRYVGAVSVPAQVIRILPPRDDSVQSRIYYEFLNFFNVTRMFEITFSAPGRYTRLAEILGQNLQEPWPEELLEKLHAAFISFRSAYPAHPARTSGKLVQTPADALLVYLGVYSLDSLLREDRKEIERRLTLLRKEFLAASRSGEIALIENRTDAEAVRKEHPMEKAVRLVEKTGAASVAGAAHFAGAVAGAAAGLAAGTGAAETTAEVTRKAVENTLSRVVPQTAADTGQKIISPAHPLRIAFIHENNMNNSGWVYGHELGKSSERSSGTGGNHGFKLRGRRETAKPLRQPKENCGMIFTTSPPGPARGSRWTIRVKVLCCSLNQSLPTVRFYYGKMYEANI